jgi:programmed cell death 8 (apoptosis-inducing factor)
LYFIKYSNYTFFFTERTRKVSKFPSESKDIPSSVPYLLIGGGTASFAAFRAIKSADPTAKVG